jgi:hypothetical protein
MVSVRNDARNRLRRIQIALEILAADLDAKRRRPSPSLQNRDDSTRGIEDSVDHFVFASEKDRCGRDG